jgi:hypothetical protein
MNDVEYSTYDFSWILLWLLLLLFQLLKELIRLSVALYPSPHHLSRAVTTVVSTLAAVSLITPRSFNSLAV